MPLGTMLGTSMLMEMSSSIMPRPVATKFLKSDLRSLFRSSSSISSTGRPPRAFSFVVAM